MLSLEQVRDSSEHVTLHLENWLHLQSAYTVMAYWPMRNEISLLGLITNNQDKAWVLPRILPNRQLALLRFDPDKLERHPWGMYEPLESCDAVQRESINMVLVPGVGFSKDGSRIGYGGGYYDRLLKGMAAVRVGITHSQMLVDRIPAESHDCLMDYVATQEGIISTSNQVHPGKNNSR